MILVHGKGADCPVDPVFMMILWFHFFLSLTTGCLNTGQVNFNIKNSVDAINLTIRGR